MADYHALSGSTDGNTVTVVAHFAVPNTVNQVGFNYRTALIQSLGGEQPSQVPFITQSEQDALNAGAVLEKSYIFYTHPGETPQEKIAKLDILHGQERTRLLNELQHQLAYWGYGRTING